MKKYIMIFVTCSTKKEARRIAEGLLRKKLIACANIIGGLESRFWWKGRVDRTNEIIILMKSIKRYFGRISKEIKKMHSYDVPEIVSLTISAGSDSYLRWIDESVGKEVK